MPWQQNAGYVFGNPYDTFCDMKLRTPKGRPYTETLVRLMRTGMEACPYGNVVGNGLDRSVGIAPNFEKSRALALQHFKRTFTHPKPEAL